MAYCCGVFAGVVMCLVKLYHGFGNGSSMNMLWVVVVFVAASTWLFSLQLESS
jgi:hypothetical protein